VKPVPSFFDGFNVEGVDQTAVMDSMLGSRCSPLGFFMPLPQPAAQRMGGVIYRPPGMSYIAVKASRNVRWFNTSLPGCKLRRPPHARKQTNTNPKP